MEKRRVVITGLGAVTPLGHTARETWEAAKAGVCGIAPITLYDHSAQKVSLAGEVKEFDPSGVLEKKEIRRMDRFAQFAVTAAAEAMAHSGLDLEREDRARIGVALSSGIGGIGTLQTSCETGQSRGFDRVSPFFIPMVITNLAAGHIAIRFGLHGMCICPVAACAGGANAVGDAFRHIRDGYAEVMVAGGAEASITPLAMGGFTSMSALTDASDSSRASIPFDKERSGFVMGEGAGLLMLEEYEHAKARGAKILGEIVGYGATDDAHHITGPSPDGEGAAHAMMNAMQEAEIAPEAVDYINAHGTSTPLNDSGETAAIRRVFGAHADRLMVSSTKSMTGHLLGASGAVEAALCVLALKGLSPPLSTIRSRTRPVTWTSCPTRAGRRTSAAPYPILWASAGTTPAWCSRSGRAETWSLTPIRSRRSCPTARPFCWWTASPAESPASGPRASNASL